MPAVKELVKSVGLGGKYYNIQYTQCAKQPPAQLWKLDSNSNVISNAPHSQCFFPDGVWLMADKPFDQEVKARSEQLLWIESACTTRSPSKCP